MTGSHVGLAFNRKAYRAVAEALSAMAAPEPWRRRPSSDSPGAEPDTDHRWIKAGGMHSGHIGSRSAACLASAPAITTRWISLAPS